MARINLAVVIVVTVTVVSLIIPGSIALRRRYEDAQCRLNLRSIGLAVDGYCDSHGMFPTADVPNPKLILTHRLSWYVNVMPWLESNIAYEFDRTKAWNDGRNIPLTMRRLPYLLCPSNPVQLDPDRSALTHYVGISGIGKDCIYLSLDSPHAGVFAINRKTTRDDLKRGAANVMLATETMRVNGPWAASGSATVRELEPNKQPYLGPNGQFNGYHYSSNWFKLGPPRTINILFADGSVRSIEKSIEPKSLANMAAISNE